MSSKSCFYERKRWFRFCLCLAVLTWLYAWAVLLSAGADPIENRSVRVGVWTDIVDGSDPSTIVEPQWKSNLPLRVNKLYIGMSSEELAAVMGLPDRKGEGDTHVYGDNVVVRLNSDSKAVNISVARPLGGRGTVWTLGQGEAEFLTLGTAESACFAKLGRPFAFYVHKKKGIRIALYSQARCDLGIFFKDGQAEGFMLTEPGMLAEGLRWSGYEIETE
ncbi:MAG: hypothetical protein ACI38Q_02990 [Candidatus Bruticola sp.]